MNGEWSNHGIIMEYNLKGSDTQGLTNIDMEKDITNNVFDKKKKPTATKLKKKKLKSNTIDSGNY